MRISSAAQALNRVRVILSHDLTTRRRIIRHHARLRRLVVRRDDGGTVERRNRSAVRPPRRRASRQRAHQCHRRCRWRDDRSRGARTRARHRGRHRDRSPVAHVHARSHRHARAHHERVQRTVRCREVQAQPARPCVSQRRFRRENAAGGFYDRPRSRRRCEHLSPQRHQRRPHQRSAHLHGRQRHRHDRRPRRSHKRHAERSR